MNDPHYILNVPHLMTDIEMIADCCSTIELVLEGRPQQQLPLYSSLANMVGFTNGEVYWLREGLTND